MIIMKKLTTHVRSKSVVNFYCNILVTLNSVHTSQTPFCSCQHMRTHVHARGSPCLFSDDALTRSILLATPSHSASPVSSRTSRHALRPKIILPECRPPSSKCPAAASSRNTIGHRSRATAASRSAAVACSRA